MSLFADLSPFAVLAVWLIGANAAAVLAFAIDKSAARTGHRRISEFHLLQIALLGGTPGAYLARQMFRHKTRKEPFSSRLHTIAILHSAMLAGLAVFFLP
jgi:uncharacterized membrane protein YsdA (DUF1294 family)